LSVETILRLTPAVLGSTAFSIAGSCADRAAGVRVATDRTWACGERRADLGAAKPVRPEPTTALELDAGPAGACGEHHPTLELGWVLVDAASLARVSPRSTVADFAAAQP
jgi:hypothetical protein